VHARHLPWEHWDWFRQRSPLCHVAQARTPILLMHNLKDTRVHPSQSLELFRYLKALGRVPVRLVLYPDEKHGSSGAADALDGPLPPGAGRRAAPPAGWSTTRPAWRPAAPARLELSPGRGNLGRARAARRSGPAEEWSWWGLCAPCSWEAR
jgi:hypothetical protein